MAAISSENPISKPVSSLWGASASSEWKRIWQKVVSRDKYQDPSMAYVVAQRLIRHHWLLVFDELQLVDVSSSSLLSDVLSWFWRMGGVVVGTSNKIPEDLYQNGVQRDRLEPFVEALKARCPVLSMDVGEGKDWRKVRAELPVHENRSTWFIGAEEKDFERALQGVLAGMYFTSF
jgi:peroxisome-assembly ATPase